MLLLITSFGPWGPHEVNASTQWWHEAEVKPPAEWALRHVVLPVDWQEAPRRLFDAMERADDLRAVVLCGLAESRCVITPERFAHNLVATDAPDVGGARYPHSSISGHGPLAHASSLPLETLLGAWQEAGVPVEESRDAGTFLCNFLAYRLAERLQATPKVRGGFIHVPPRSQLDPGQWQRAAEVVVSVMTSSRGGAS